MQVPILRLLGFVALAMALTGCNGPVFNKVQIKASPQVNAALGSVNTEISSYVSVKAVRNMLKSSPDVEVFDYQPDAADLTQSFLIHYPLTKVELDFGQYMKDLSLDNTLSQALTPGSFKVPSIDTEQSQTGSFDLNSTLRSQVNTGFGTATTKLVETGLSSSKSLTLPDASITVTEFTTATFSKGSLNLALSLTNATAGLTLTATKINLEADGKVITTSSADVDLVAGGTAVLPLAGKTLPSTFAVVISVSTKGGTALHEVTVNAVPSLSNDVTVSAATGITLSTNVTVPNVTVPIESGGTLVSAKVKTGSIKIEQSPLPTTWTGFVRTTSVNLTQTSGLTLASGAQTIDDITLDLAGKTLNPNDITVSATSSIQATNASFSGLDGGPISVDVNAVVAVAEFEEITVHPGTDFEPTQKFNETMSQQMIDWVDSIDFTKVGIEFTISNNMPTGNPMTIDLKSTAFGIAGGSPVNLPSGQLAGQSTLASFTKSGYTLVPATMVDKTGDGKPDLDFEVTMQPTSYNATTGDMVLYNIVPGRDLSVGGTVALVADWTKAIVSPPAGGYTGNFPSDDPTDFIDLGTLKDYLGDKINLGTIPAHFYLSGPTSNMTAVVQATYTNSAGTKVTQDLINTGATAVPLLPAGPTFPVDVDTITTPWDITTTTPVTKVPTSSFELQSILNAKPSDLRFNYSLNMTTLTVNNIVGQTSELRADLVMILPMKLIAAEGATLDVGQALPEDDLFGRTAGEDNSGTNDMLKNLGALSMTLAIDNGIGLGGEATLSDQAGGFSKVIHLNTGKSKSVLKLNSSDIQYIINHVPFVLQLGVGIPEDEYSILRGGGLTAKITVSVTADVDQTIELGGKN